MFILSFCFTSAIDLHFDSKKAKPTTDIIVLMRSVYNLDYEGYDCF